MLIDESVRSDPGIYPTEGVRSKLSVDHAESMFAPAESKLDAIREWQVTLPEARDCDADRGGATGRQRAPVSADVARGSEAVEGPSPHPECAPRGHSGRRRAASTRRAAVSADSQISRFPVRQVAARTAPADPRDSTRFPIVRWSADFRPRGRR